MQINKNFKTLTPDSLISVLIGILLGDGGIYRTSSTSNCRFEMSFGQHSSAKICFIHPTGWIKQIFFFFSSIKN